MSTASCIDRRPVGTGMVGPVATALQKRYFAVVRGLDPQHADQGVVDRLHRNGGLQVRSVAPLATLTGSQGGKGHDRAGRAKR